MTATQILLRRACASYFLLVAVSANACGASSQDKDAGAGDAGPTVFVPCPGATEPGPTGLLGADVTREGIAGSIDVTVAFCNPLIPEPPNELLFFVTLTDHFDLAASDLTQGTSVATDAGLRSDDPVTWDGNDLSIEGDHHAKGHLHAPNHTAGGTSLLGPETGYLELTLGGIGGDGSIVVRWEKEYLP